MEKLTEQKDWDNTWDAEGHGQSTKLTIAPLLHKILSPEKRYSFIEIGCAPGTNMAYVYKHFNYDVAGIDYAGVPETKEYLTSQNIPNELFDCDAFKFKSEKKYDIVFSTGFIEHFDPIDEAINVHKSLCADEGFVVIVIPNMRYFNKLMVRLLQPHLIPQHNLKIMNPKVFARYFSKDSGYIIRYCNYYKTSLLDIEPNYDFTAGHSFVGKLYKCLSWISSKIGLSNIPNRFFSPNIVLIAQKNKR